MTDFENDYDAGIEGLLDYYGRPVLWLYARGGNSSKTAIVGDPVDSEETTQGGRRQQRVFDISFRTDAAANENDHCEIDGIKYGVQKLRVGDDGFTVATLIVNRVNESSREDYRRFRQR